MRHVLPSAGDQELRSYLINREEDGAKHGYCMFAFNEWLAGIQYVRDQDFASLK